jgi:aminoglycoside phosphotransferase (APT) family kinase protein
MTQPLDADHALTLFLGDGPAIAVESTGTAGEAAELASLPDASAGSILVRIARHRHGAAPIRALLDQCRRVLRDDGRVAVVLGNRWGPLLSRIRTRTLAGSAGRPGMAAMTGGTSLRTVLKAIDRTGFADVSVFSACPDSDEPPDVRLATSRADRLLSPGFLVTAGKAGALRAPVIQQIADRVALRSAGNDFRLSTITHVANSSRGKSIAFVDTGTNRSVIRIPRSQVARLDEARAHALLGELHGDPRLAGLVATPLLCGTEGGHTFFAESRVEGHPLARRLSVRNRHDYLVDVERFLHALNPDLDRRPLVALDETVHGGLHRPMLEHVLRHLDDEGLEREARALVEKSLHGAHSRLGTVHGDFGTSNILELNGSITAVVDWEAARQSEPPVLDAFNYLDSAHRTCTPSLSIVDTVPMLSRGDWPVDDEHRFLERFLDRCGIERRFRRGFALMYFLFHIGPQLRFADRETGPKRRLELVFRQMLA